jgi:Fe/S biogenesis protein NfuA
MEMLGWFKRRGEDSPTDGQERSAARVNLTSVAREQLSRVLGEQGPDTALRLIVRNPGGAVPEYDMSLDTPGPADVALDADGLRIITAHETLAAADGATIDFISDPLRPGFRVDPPRAASDDSPLAAEVRSLLESHINPSIASHGGRAELVATRDDVVYLALGGGCQGCSMASVTLKQGIEQVIKQMIPSVREVVDVTDHAQGSNPFYTSEKGGESPFHQHAKA